MGPDGQLIVDEGTLTVQAQPEEITRRNVVSELPMLNSQSYAVNRAPSERWTPEETENFYAVRLPAGSPAVHGHRSWMAARLASHCNFERTGGCMHFSSSRCCVFELPAVSCCRR